MVVAISDRPYGTLWKAVDHKLTVYAPQMAVPRPLNQEKEN